MSVEALDVHAGPQAVHQHERPTMQLKRLFTDDKAVSPVVGVTLMIAIAVVLAAVVGGLVLGLGQGQDPTPTASIEFEQGDFDGTANGIDVRLSHDGGDALAHDKITVMAGSNNDVSVWSTSGSKVTAGDTATIDTEVNLGDGDVVKVVWEEGDRSAVIAKYTVEG